MLSVNDGEIQLTRGDTARLTVAIENAATGERYDPGDGDKLTLTVRKTETSSEILLQKIVTGGNLFTILPEDTSGLAFRSYVYDVQLDTADGDVYTIVGPEKFTVGKEVTY